MGASISLAGFGVELKPLSSHKLEKVRMWRNHPKITQFMLDKTYISADQQQTWFKSLRNREDQVYLLISYKDEDIGVINAKSVDNAALKFSRTIAPGLYIAPECKYKNSILAFSPSLVFIEHLFGLEQCQRLMAKVLAHNTSAIRYNETLGYVKESINNEGIIIMSLSPDVFNQKKLKLSKILRF